MARKSAKKSRKGGRKGARKTTMLDKFQKLEQQRASLAAEAEAIRRQAVAEKKAQLAVAKAEMKEAADTVAALEKDLAAFGAAPVAAAAPAKKAARKGRKPGRKPGRKASKKAAKKTVKKAAKKVARKGRKTTPSGRKPRVSKEVKTQHVADVMKSHGKGIAFSALRKLLLARKTPDGVAVFSTPDLASSRQFAAKLLPKGYKVTGERKTAKVVKG